MRATVIVAIFGVVCVVAAVAILVVSGPARPEGPMTPVERGARIFRMQGCASCHKIGGGMGRGPDLAGLISRLALRLQPETYRPYLAQVRREFPRLYDTEHGVWEDILRREGDDRVRAWLKAHLRNPRFDHPRGEMPGYPHLTQEQADNLVAFLFTLR